jgi:transcriptional regulator with XRE-family HTH domain
MRRYGYNRGRVIRGRVRKDSELPPVNQQLRRLRWLMGWSQSEIAEHLAISKRTYEAWEQGVREAAPDYFRKALRTAVQKLRVTLDEVKKIGGSDVSGEESKE